MKKKIMIIAKAILLIGLALGFGFVWVQILLGEQLTHDCGMEAYHLEIEYLELRGNENVSCFEVSMIEEALFIAHFELNSEIKYIIHYGHLEGKFVIDTQTVILNHSTSEYFQDFYFQDIALVGLYSINRFCSNGPIAFIHIKNN